MGSVSRHQRRDLSRYETVYEDPEFAKLLRATSRESQLTARSLAGSGVVETMCGLAAVIVTVLGLSQRAVVMGAVATIVIGIALVTQGTSMLARWRQARHRVRYAPDARSELFEGMLTELFGGVVGIVLAVLVLAGLAGHALLPVAAIVYGVTLLLGGTMQPALVYLAPERSARHESRAIAAIDASGGLMVLVSIASVVLGILALVGVGPPVELALVAMLCIGFALVIAGGSLTARFVRPFT